MAISLLIKGGAEQARAALDKRGLLTVEALDPFGPKVGTTRAKVHDSDLGAVMVWFAEPAQPIVGEGFPPGTLLIYAKE